MHAEPCTFKADCLKDLHDAICALLPFTALALCKEGAHAYIGQAGQRGVRGAGMTGGLSYHQHTRFL